MDDAKRAKTYDSKLHQDFLNRLAGIAENIANIQRSTGATANLAALIAAANRFRNEVASKADELDKVLADAEAKIEAAEAEQPPAEPSAPAEPPPAA